MGSIGSEDVLIIVTRKDSGAVDYVFVADAADIDKYTKHLGNIVSDQHHIVTHEIGGTVRLYDIGDESD